MGGEGDALASPFFYEGGLGEEFYDIVDGAGVETERLPDLIHVALVMGIACSDG